MSKPRQIISIGGGGFGRNPGQGIIEQYILDQTKKRKPKICFIPTATGDLEAYKLNYYATFANLNCQPTHLDFFKRTPDLEKLISSQDAIFVGGGNTKSMLAVWRDWGLDRILKKAYEKGTVMSGVSAGAICWFERGITDSWAKDLKIMDCLDFVSGVCCPHYDEEPQRRPTVHRMLKRNSFEACFAIDGGCALHLIDEKPYKAVVFNKRKNSYEVTKKNTKINEKPFSKLAIY